MKTIILSQKWRPKKFSDILGQESTLKILEYHLSNKKLHQSFLFSGSSGCGKTSIARIFAKSLNCKNGISFYPCQICSNCIEIEENRFLDFIEIDGATNTKVEDIREILESTKYYPSKGNFKIYLIDEVHMLSKYSFNSLLKTLEEPKKHVKFFFATTEPKKVPITILSRCLHFYLGKISEKEIFKKLEIIAKKENIAIDKKSLDLISKFSNGNMRESINIMDQASALTNRNIKSKHVRKILSLSSTKETISLLKYTIQKKGEKVLEKIQNLFEKNINLENFLDDFLNLLYKILVKKIFFKNSNEKKLINLKISNTIKNADIFELQHIYKTILKRKKYISYLKNKKLGIEMIFLEIIYFKKIEL
ncbi:DNA polymerase III subunit gamma/tau [bacterium endosymbiont of Pedicinus badii]|uniref:DNA polymerase III subunit gamma/tau n=1 Tax=bacterium endosymbiont of Pedicinus badii TaxID=1719126 RepID=UPI0009BC517C|nr:DNA polymerase III subunit gamma/tau [bacterium endosymbiont of Pedicinus badii]OQM34296.1 hypothetical protein AOQ89_00130 [bacterium endosymbiont of Pedicinus badii]